MLSALLSLLQTAPIVRTTLYGCLQRLILQNDAE